MNSQHALEIAEYSGGYLAAGRQMLRNGAEVNVTASALRALVRAGVAREVLSPEGGYAIELLPAHGTPEALRIERQKLAARIAEIDAALAEKLTDPK